MDEQDDLQTNAAPDLDGPDAASAPLAKNPPPDLDGPSDSADASLDAAIERSTADASGDDIVDGRDPKTGRFATAKAVTTGTTGEATTPVTTDAQPTTGAVDRFASFPPEHRAAYDGLPPEARAVVDAHETHIMGRVAAHVEAEIAPLLRQADPFMAEITRPETWSYLQRVASETGAQPQQIVSRVLGFENTLRYGTMAQKVALLNKMAADYGVTGKGEGDADVDPAMHDMQRQLRERDYRLQQLEKQQQDQAAAALNREVSSFVTAKDSQGNPQYPFFDAVRGTMADLIEAGRARNYHEAYEIAAKPFKDEMARVTRSSGATQRDRAALAVARAERTQPIKGSMGPQTVATKNLDDIISSALDAAAA